MYTLAYQREAEPAEPGDRAVVPGRQLDGALRLLEHAKACARDADHQAWDFAVEIESLLDAGLTRSDLRWMVSKGYLEHADESTRPGHRRRTFRRSSNLAFSKRTCFMLTASGEALNDVGPAPLRAFSAEPSPGVAAIAGDGAAGENDTPVWDAACRELRLRGQIVKRFKVPSPIQESILAAFEEEGWPAAIDDPLPPHPEQDQRRRLRNTIQNLNTNQRVPLIHFRGDGSGERVLWELGHRRDRRHAPRRRRAAASRVPQKGAG
jgi:hypothetical protein